MENGNSFEKIEIRLNALQKALEVTIATIEKNETGIGLLAALKAKKDELINLDGPYDEVGHCFDVLFKNAQALAQED
ncbi:hypothetical protein W822_20090 [Advenella kashmirensis W13003]|uniref:Uncharacterized protein n=1 Tax=Advenella kashmirensis W13003 TaxID=1424334 RepID=V8QPL9_9BURK|nr:hypothetical protein [Advenella kashmirensis]ETF00944.1 hypothetical protein W822_20090 [Advenella kashmirensis W13003]